MGLPNWKKNSLPPPLLLAQQSAPSCVDEKLDSCDAKKCLLGSSEASLNFHEDAICAKEEKEEEEEVKSRLKRSKIRELVTCKLSYIPKISGHNR